MNELDTEWERKLAEAQRRARASGRNDVLDYLSLRAANDFTRTVGIEWLLEAFTTLAGEANRAGAGLTIDRTEAHRFQVGNSTMNGMLLTLRAGVRALTIEAGWPRTPRDGIVRGGGLASAYIGHFGNRAAGEHLLLVRGENGAPQWRVVGPSGAHAKLSEAYLRQHLARLLPID